MIEPLVLVWEDDTTGAEFTWPVYVVSMDQLNETLDLVDVDYWHRGITVYGRVGIVGFVNANVGSPLKGA